MVETQAKAKKQENLKTYAIALFTDFGASSTKALYYRGKRTKDKTKLPAPKGDLTPILMASEVGTGTWKSLKQQLGEETSLVSPEERTWIKLNPDSNSDEVNLVGGLANRYKGDLGLKQSKFVRALIKLFGLCSVICEKENLFKGKTETVHLELDLFSFLPYGEKGNFAYFRKAFSFVCNQEIPTVAGKIQISLRRFYPLSEGEGIAHALLGKGITKFTQVMLGFRNTSILNFDNGKIVGGLTPPKGMNNLVRQVGETEGINDYPALLRTMLDYQDRQDWTPFYRLFVAESDFMKKERIHGLIQTIARSRREYIDELLSQIKQEMASDSQQLVLAGGSASYLRHSSDFEEKLKAKFPWLDINWHGDVQIPTEVLGEEDAYYRFSDVYGEYLYRTRQTQGNS